MNLSLFAALCTSVGAGGMAAIGLYVAAIHYPAFRWVPEESFLAFHRRHAMVTGAIVMPLMAAECLGAAYLVWSSPSWWHWAGVGFATAGIALTFAVSAPIHGLLSRGKDDALIDRLIRTSWPRAWAWLAHVVVLLLGSSPG